jgi:hypothetical protein
LTLAASLILAAGMYALFAAGVLSGIGTLLWLLTHQTVWRDRFYHRLTRDAIHARPTCWVDPDDAEAVFVEIVPRERWGKFMLETASDFGFLKLDFDSGWLLFEGNVQRYAIPVDAMTSHVVEPVSTLGNVEHHVVTVRAEDAVTKVEVPFSPYGAPWRSGAKATARRAHALWERIEGIVLTWTARGDASPDSASPEEGSRSLDVLRSKPDDTR